MVEAGLISSGILNSFKYWEIETKKSKETLGKPANPATWFANYGAMLIPWDRQ